MGGLGEVEVVNGKGCSRMFMGFSNSVTSFKGLQSFGSMSPAPSSIGSESLVRSSGPFSGLVICVTGLSKETRNQVKEATERLGGQYSPSLHPQCTHLVVQSLSGRKFEHAVKHGARNGLFVVTLGWFVDSVKKNVRLSESLYTVKNTGENGTRVDELNRLVGVTSEKSCLPAGLYEAKKFDSIEKPHLQSSWEDSNRSSDSTLSGRCIFIDADISNELRKKVIDAATKEGATVLDRWCVGCNASHVVCEGTSAYRYIGHCSNLVTPLWILKTAREKFVQRLLHMSADLTRQIGTLLENPQNTGIEKEINKGIVSQDSQEGSRSSVSQEARQQIVNHAKTKIRNRRGRRMQTCQVPIRPITPSTLLDSICWSISEPTSTASIYTDSFSNEDVNEQHSIFFDAKDDGKDSRSSFTNLTRFLTESEKKELVFKNHLLTILFPIDRFSEMGPSSRTYFSDDGFTCSQVLDYIYSFYQENMSEQEIEAAIHTDSRHADRLRAVYSGKETVERGFVVFKRIEFLGSRKSFEMLKRVSGDNSSNVYELLIRA